MMEDCERLAEIEKIIGEISDRSLCGAVILVEGKRDVESLFRLGITGEIIMTSQKQVLHIADHLAQSGREVIILTDWDERGEEVARLITTYMESNGVRPDNKLRENLGQLIRRDIKDVENLFRFVEKLQQTCALKPQHY